MRGAGVPGLRGLGVYGKDGVPGSSVQKTGSQGLLKTRGLSFLWLNDQNTQNINVIHYTGFKANWLKLAIKLRIPSFSTARNACMRGMFPDWPVWILFPREIWLHKPSEKSIDILSVKWEKSYFPLNVLLWIASQLCVARRGLQNPATLKTVNSQQDTLKVLRAYRWREMGNKKEIEMGVLDRWSSQIFSGKQKSSRKTIFWWREGLQQSRDRIGLQIGSNPDWYVRFWCRRNILRNAVFNNPSSDNRILTYD